jgi:hypothetical protein
MDNLSTCLAARDELAKRRLTLITSLTHTSGFEQTQAHVDLLIRIQNAIEVIDKVATEERQRNAPGTAGQGS